MSPRVEAEVAKSLPATVTRARIRVLAGERVGAVVNFTSFVATPILESTSKVAPVFVVRLEKVRLVVPPLLNRWILAPPESNVKAPATSVEPLAFPMKFNVPPLR